MTTPSTINTLVNLSLNPLFQANPAAFTAALGQALVSSGEINHGVVLNKLNTLATAMKESDPVDGEHFVQLLSTGRIFFPASQLEIVKILEKIPPDTLKKAAEKLASLVATQPAADIGRRRFENSEDAVQRAREILSPKIPLNEELVEVTKSMGWGEDAQSQLHTRLIEAAGENIEYALDVLPTALMTMEEAGVSHEQQTDVFVNMVKKFGKRIEEAMILFNTVLIDLQAKGDNSVSTFLTETAEEKIWNDTVTPESAMQNMKRQIQFFPAKFLLSERSESFRMAMDAMQEVRWSPEQKKQLANYLATRGSVAALANFPKAVVAMKGSVWNLDQQYQLLILFVKRSGGSASTVFDHLGSAITALDSTGWSVGQKYQYLTLLAENGGLRAGFALKLFPEVKAAMDQMGWSSEQQWRYLTSLAEDTGGSLRFAMPRLASALLSMKDTGWSPEQQYRLLTHLTKQWRGNIGFYFENFALFVASMKNSAESFDEMFKLLARIKGSAGSSRDGTLRPGLKNMAVAVTAMRQTDLSPEQQSQLFRLFEKLDYNKSPLLIDIIAGMNGTGWSANLKYRLLTYISEKYGHDAVRIYVGLANLLANKGSWSNEEEFRLLIDLESKTNVPGLAFRLLVVLSQEN